MTELVSHLPKDNDISFDLFYFDFKGKARPPAPKGCTLRPYRAVPGMIIQQSWKRLGWPLFDSLAPTADLYHFTNFVIPPVSAGVKTVVSIHDISFILHPEFAEKRNLDYLSSRIASTTKRADAVITISQQSARDLTERLHVAPEKLIPIHLGVSDRFAPAPHESVCRTRAELALDKPFILMVGTFEPRKNITFAVELFERMTAFDGDLVIVGQKGWKNAPVFERIASSPAADRIRTLTALDDQHLVNLYSGAEFLLMTSLYEGFGFPPIEAMACGTPVLSSSGGSLREVCGDAAVVLDGYDLEQWLENAHAILHDSTLRADLSNRGQAKAKAYTWQKTADEHLKAYRRVLH